MYYGPSSVKNHLLSCLPSSTSKAFIITGSSLASKTPLIHEIEQILGPKHRVGTFSKIKQHAPIAQLDEARDAVAEDSSIDTLISVGGGSPIDSAKAISYRVHEKDGKFLFHITIPTTLSAAECSFGAGYTSENGTKQSIADPGLVPTVIIYDSKFALETPSRLWLSTGIRALDHSIELMYHPTATELPARTLCLNSIAALFEYLPKYKSNPKDEDAITRLQLASFGSLYPIGLNFKDGLGLSHTLGYALGSPYGIPHGITSCLTLAKVVRLKAENPADAEQLSRILPFIGKSRCEDMKQDAMKVSDAIEKLVAELGLKSRLNDFGIGEDQVLKITKLATKSEDGKLYDDVANLVKTLL